MVTAGHDVENIELIDYGKKYSAQNNAFKARFDSLDSKFNGKSLDDYINGKSFCCSGKNLDEIEQNETNSAENAKLEDNLYFYHPDHLGSTSMVTNFDGEVTQNVSYIPYGEIFVEERNGSWNTPYLFNAKELDEETGLYYYGARYLDPTHVAWLSVDPLWDDHKGVSPYAYCLGNPVRFVDNDGRAESESETTQQTNPNQPTKCPQELMGTPEYYDFRKADFEKRNPGKEAPDYYENYGKKYALKFAELKKDVSKQGKEWIDKTMLNLQEAMEKGLENGGSELESNAAEFKKFAYGTHAESYIKAGIANLNFIEMVKIGMTPDFSDLITIEGVKQVIEVGFHVLPYLNMREMQFEGNTKNPIIAPAQNPYYFPF